MCASIFLLLKLLRVHQYAKNMLIFLPWILSHQYHDTQALLQLLKLFFSFSALASSAYIINDVVDLNADRIHPVKKNRPIASGVISIQPALLIAGCCFLLAWLIAMGFSTSLKLILLFYWIATGLYSYCLKQLLLVDVITLSSLYTTRILSGMVAIQTDYSKWVLLFSLFFFTSLAFLKRFSELSELRTGCEQKIAGRGYHISHLDTIKVFGIGSGYLSVLIIALYLNSKKAIILYAHPIFLYAVCPLLIYWISRVWLLAVDGKMPYDPVIFAIRDKLTYAILFVIFLIGVIATI